MCTNHVTDYLPTLMLAAYWSINDFRVISKSHFTFQCISINMLKLRFSVGFQMAGIMFSAKTKALRVSYAFIVKALLQCRRTINQECIRYWWEISTSLYVTASSFLSSLFWVYYFSLTVIFGRTVKYGNWKAPTSEQLSVKIVRNEHLLARELCLDGKQVRQLQGRRQSV